MSCVVSRGQAVCGPTMVWSRGEFFGWLLLIGVANGLMAAAVEAVHESGWRPALLESFGVSMIVWSACGAGVLLFDRKADPAPLARADLAVAAGCVPLLLAPAGWMGWLAVTGLGIHLLRGGGLTPVNRRATTILLAATVPMLWSRLVFQLFTELLLRIDAWLVAAVVGTQRTGNMVHFVQGDGYLVVFPACSSLANLSLAGLCWVVIAQLAGHGWARRDWAYIAAICVVVVGANVGRMSLMAVSERNYVMWHGVEGEALANLGVTALVIGISLLGVRHELA